MSVDGGFVYIRRGGDGMKRENDFTLFKGMNSDELKNKILVQNSDGNYVLLKTLSSLELQVIVHDKSTCALWKNVAKEILATK